MHVLPVSRSGQRRFLWVLVGSLIIPWGTLRALVINEIMYHSEELDDRPFEWIELYNERKDPLDLTDYSICNGVAGFTFPRGTFLDGFSYLVVVQNRASFATKYDTANIDVIGGWPGGLNNGGERLEICNPAGIVVLSIRYNDRGKWPAAADGTGHSLSLIDPYADISDPDGWVHSVDLGGTPGAWNGHGVEVGGGPTSLNGMDGGGFILEWLTLGPYTGSRCNLGSTALRGDWLRQTSPSTLRQTNQIWRDGDLVRTNYSSATSTGLHNNAPGNIPRVELYESFSDTINLNDAVYPPNPEDVMAYSFVYVDNVTGAALPVTLACASDDAIAILLNGTHVHVNDACRGVGAPGTVQDRVSATLRRGKNTFAVKVFERGGGWSFRLRIEERGTARPITSQAVIQVMTDVDAGLDFDGNGTPLLPVDGGGGGPPDPGMLPGTSPVVINEALIRPAGPRWLEIYNRSGSLVNLSGYFLTDDPSNLTKVRIADGTTISAGGFLSFTDGELGLDFTVTPELPRVFLALVEPTGERVADAFNFEPLFDGFSEARIPDGTREFDDGADPTRNGANRLTVERPIVINEVMYHPIDDDLDKEYVELYNPGPDAVNLTGWALTKGFNFAFPDGTVMQPRTYLVVARNPDLIRSIHGLPASSVVGPEPDPVSLANFGILRDSGERITLKDELLRTVDTVRFFDGGEWPRWADGHGSSLELIDWMQDNRVGMAWDASDDSAKAETRTYTYGGRHGAWSPEEPGPEFHILLLNRGMTLVDDITVLGGATFDETVLVDSGEVWRYFKGTRAPPANWRTLGFNDGSWLSGATGIGYGDGDDATVLNDMQNNYVSIFCRKTFNVSNPGAIEQLVLSITIDDGFIAYLNGQEVGSFNVSAGAGFDTTANSAGEPQLIERTIPTSALRSGTNVLAVQVHNGNASSSDLSFIPRLVDRSTAPGGAGSELIVNGHFNTSTTGWAIEGTHIRSGRTTLDPINGAGSLKLVASGRGDNKVNRVETRNTGMRVFGNPNEDLIISFQARWVIGSQTLLTHGYRSSMARSHELAVPENLGTPGRVNSVSTRQSAVNGGNLGPLITDVRRDKVVPGAREAVAVRARVIDSDGVAPNSVRIRWSRENPASSPSSVTMSSIGGDWYEGSIPGQTLGTKIVFTITANDTQGASGRFPVNIRERTHPLVLNPNAPSLNDQRFLIYRHEEENPASAFQNYRFWMTSSHQGALGSRRLLSNDLLPGSFLFEARKIYYESGVRFAGSPFARGGWGGSFRVTMPRDDLLHGTIRKLNLDNHHGNGLNARERISHYLIRNNQGSTPTPYSDLQVIVRWQVNSQTVNTLEHTWVPDVQFIDLWFPGDDDGDFLEMDDRFIITDSGGRRGNTDGRVRYPPSSARSDGDGANKENYRGFFGLRAKNGADDFTSFLEFCRLMDPGATSTAQFDRLVWDNVNVEEMLRIWAVRLNTDDWDTWGANRGKNCYFYQPPRDGRWNLLAWDMELTYGNVNAFLIPSSPTSAYNPGGFTEVHRMMNRPAIKRMFYGILSEMVNGTQAWFTSTYLTTYMNKLSSMGMSATEIGRSGGFIDQRRNLLRTRIRSVVYPQVRFRITTRSGADFSTDQIAVDLRGSAPVDVGTIVIRNNDGDDVIYPVTFPTLTTWRVDDIPLHPGINRLTLRGHNLKGNFIQSDTITVTSTAVDWPPPQITAISPAEALSGEIVQIRGVELHNGVRVFFGGAESPNVLFDELGPNPDLIFAEVPPGDPGGVNVTVRNIDEKSSNPVGFTYLPPPPKFVRGDSNGDGLVDLSDAVKNLLFLFSGQAIDCEDAADANDDEVLSVTDSIYVLDYIFRGRSAPRAPFPSAGEDPSGEALGCERLPR
ncbi:MAG: lamin tail domain-containing protein [Planctomycetota bacterium]|nr:lamin tail domain-containing protein [Planctomycetota bacterium]